MKTKHSVALAIGLLAVVELGYVVITRLDLNRTVLPALADLLVGRDSDQSFRQTMIQRHRTAIAIAERELATGDDPQALALAKQMLETRKNELALLETLDPASR